LQQALADLGRKRQGEYYLTDVIGGLVARGLAVEAVALDDPEQAHGVNTPRRAGGAQRAAALRRLAE
jgi:bifunctional N-acetylglucosamine-1-phosphate-uridyltransferase/glucosamine-1-phosphate-acetyltransferase GlmU-like protein